MKKTLSVIIALAMILTVFAATATAVSAAETYILVYSPNGGRGMPIMESNLTDGQKVVLRENTYACVDATMEFSHWNTMEDGSGTSYDPGDEFVIDASQANTQNRIAIYAIWEKVPGVYVRYQKNTDDPACEGELADHTEYPKGTEVTVKGVTTSYRYPLHKFMGWNTEADGTGTTYQPDDKFIINETTHLYAMWQNVEQEVTFFDVTFDANGGEGEMLPESEIPAGGSIMAPDCEFTYDGYMFDSWNTEADGTGTRYEVYDDVPVEEDLVLYAIWTETDLWDYNPDDGETAGVAVAVAVSAIALGALAVVAKKKIED